jgi:hypothetical protein
VLVEDVQEREPICHRDPGIAHPDVEIALVFLIGLLRKLGAFSSHPPRVVGLGSHELPSVCPQSQQMMIFLSRSASVRSATHRELFFSCLFALAHRPYVERNCARRLAGCTLGEKVMPRYFFHLSFGQRLVADEEGVELPNRSAARDEALAVVRELANPEVGGNARRWASWFLQVVDDEGQFFRTPVGYPALEIVTADGQELDERRIRPNPAARLAQQSAGPTTRRALVQQIWAIRQHTAQLMADNRRLREELSSLYLASENIRLHARRTLALAQLMPGEGR